MNTNKFSLVFLTCAVAASMIQAQPASREIKDIEKKVIEQAGESKVTPKAGGGTITAPAVTLPPSTVPAGADKLNIRQVKFEGDVAGLTALGLRGGLTADLEGQTLAGERVEQIVKAYNKWLVDNGYYLARITEEFDDIERGVLTLVVDMGRVGKVTFYELPVDYSETEAADRKQQRQPYHGYFSETQLLRKLREVEAGEVFNYNNLHRNLFSINALPDVVVNTDLHISKQAGADGLESRSVDMDMYVEDRLPLHAVLELKNTGTDNTDEERAEFTVQHLNLTKRDDALTLTAPVSLDFETLRGISGSYLVPHYMGQGGGVSVYGGYTELEADEIVETINLDGDGYFAGARTFYRLKQDDRHSLNAALGVTYSALSDRLTVGADSLDSEVEILPLSAGLTYQSGQLDSFRGRNFLAALATYNLGDAAGVTDDADAQSQRVDAEAEYYYFQLQYSRIQTLGGKYDQNSGEYVGAWYGYFNVDAQYTDDLLIPSEQKAAGGFESVRGYDERPVAGERGVSGKVELRTPIYKGAITRALSFNKYFEERQKSAVDYVQFNTFLDYGWIELLETSASAKEDFTLVGVGAGIRFSFTENSQVKLDYGFPLEELEGSSNSGRLHWAVEVQW